MEFIIEILAGILKTIYFEELFMKKKLVSIVIALLAVITFANGVSAASDYSLVIIMKGSTTQSSNRIYVPAMQTVTVDIKNYEGTRIDYMVFKNGVAYSGWTSSQKETKTHTFRRDENAEYSLRIYCYSKANPKTNCYAQGMISTQ